MRVGLDVGHARIVEVFSTRDLPQQPQKVDGRHRINQADIEQTVVDDGVRRDEAAAADQPRVAHRERVEHAGFGRAGEAYGGLHGFVVEQDLAPPSR